MPLSQSADELLALMLNGDRTSQRTFWNAFLFRPYAFSITEALVTASLEAMSFWGNEPNDDMDLRMALPITTIWQLLKTAAHGQESFARVIADHLLKLCESPNCAIASYSMRYFVEFPRFGSRSVPILMRIASGTIRPTDGGTMPTPMYAFHILSLVSPESARDPALNRVRDECIAYCLDRARELSDMPDSASSYQNYCEMANRYMWL